MKKIGYNDGDNPYLAAQDFIAEHELDQNFLDDIAKFIIRNVGEPAAKAVGKQRAAAPNAQSAPSSTPSVPKSTLPVPSIPPSSSKHFPVLKPILFEAANFEQLSSRIKAANDELFASAKDSALTPEEAAMIEAVIKKLSQTRFYHVSTFSEKEFGAIEKALKSWPIEKLPVVFDILRVMALHPVGVRRFLDGKLLLAILARAVEEGSHPASVVLAFRLVSNCFALDSVKSSLIPFTYDVLDRVIIAFGKANQNGKLAIATALLNFASLGLTTNSLATSIKAAAVTSSLISSAAANDGDGELSFILLAALGTSVYWNADVRASVKELIPRPSLHILTQSPNVRTKEASSDLISILS
jgi:phospholipase A-2-activating protein